MAPDGKSLASAGSVTQLMEDALFTQRIPPKNPFGAKSPGGAFLLPYILRG